MDYKYSVNEQETVINMFHQSISKQAEIFTCIPQTMEKLRKLASEHPGEVSLIEKQGCVTATVPMNWVKIQPKRKCNLTEEQRRANAERLALYREAKQNDAT